MSTEVSEAAIDVVTKEATNPLPTPSSLEARVAQIEQLAAVVENLSLAVNKLAAKEEINYEDDDGEEGEDPEESLASYCNEIAMLPTPKLASVQSLALTQLMMAIQCVLCYGFFDSVFLMVIRGAFNIYSDPIRPAEFYAQSTLHNGECTGPDGLSDDNCSWLPNINVVAGFFAVALLCAGPVLADDYTTVAMVQPIEALLIDTRPRKRGVFYRIWDLLALIAMQMAWAYRAAIQPMMGILGTAMAMTTAESAFDIVLNSLAISFVFEIDDMLYAIWRPGPRNLRKAYESGATCPTSSPRTVPGSMVMARRWAWALLLIDGLVAEILFFNLIHAPVDPGLVQGNRSKFNMYVYAVAFGRGLAFIGLSCHLNVRALMHQRANKEGAAASRSFCADALRVVLCALVTAVSLGIWFCIFTFGLEPYLGFNFHDLLNPLDAYTIYGTNWTSRWSECLDSFTMLEDCANGAASVSNSFELYSILLAL